MSALLKLFINNYKKKENINVMGQITKGSIHEKLCKKLLGSVFVVVVTLRRVMALLIWHY